MRAGKGEMSIKDYLFYQDSWATIYCADCREILPLLGPVDLVLTDPPYGVILGEADNGQRREKGQQPYSLFSDTHEYLIGIIIPAFVESLNISKRAIVFCGVRNIWDYPKPDDMGVWYVPAGSGIGKWGFICAHPVLYYGSNPHHGIYMSSNSYRTLKPLAEKNGHPCPKPITVMRWAVEKGSIENELILDPFMGSGTTLVAAKNLNRKSIGIEIEPKYCEIAVKRLRQEVFDFRKKGA